MLRPINNDSGGRPYCGPAAISSITGAKTSLIYKKIRRIRNTREKSIRQGNRLLGGSVFALDGKRIPIRGMYNGEIVETMKRLGWPVKERSGDEIAFSLARTISLPNRSLRSFCENRAHMGPFIVETTRHYVAVSHGLICDTRTNGVPIPWQQYPKLSRRVRKWWRF